MYQSGKGQNGVVGVACCISKKTWAPLLCFSGTDHKVVCVCVCVCVSMSESVWTLPRVKGKTPVYTEKRDQRLGLSWPEEGGPRSIQHWLVCVFECVSVCVCVCVCVSVCVWESLTVNVTMWQREEEEEEKRGRKKQVHTSFGFSLNVRMSVSLDVYIWMQKRVVLYLRQGNILIKCSCYCIVCCCIVWSI